MPTSRAPAATRPRGAVRWSAAAVQAGSWPLARQRVAQVFAQLLHQVLPGSQCQQRHTDLLRQALPACAARFGQFTIGMAQVVVAGVLLLLLGGIAEALQTSEE